MKTVIASRGNESFLVQCAQLEQSNPFTVQEIAPNVHAQVLDIAPPAPPIAGGAESAAITTNWAGAWLDITDADGDNGHQPDAGMYDSATQTFTFGTDTANMDLKSKNFRAYRLKVLIN